jgi:hypothetical protein
MTLDNDSISQGSNSNVADGGEYSCCDLHVDSLSSDKVKCGHDAPTKITYELEMQDMFWVSYENKYDELEQV